MARHENLTKKVLFRKTLPYLKKEFWLFILTIISSLIVAVLSAFTPFITKAILDEFLPLGEYSKIVKALIIYGVIIFIIVVFRYIYQYIHTLTGMHIERRVREDAIKKINYLAVDYYSLEPDGKIVAKITNDSAGVRVFYMTMFSIFNALLNIAIVYVGVIILEPKLGLLILALIPILSLWITLYRKKVHKYFVETRETGSRITGKLNELISGALIIQDFNQEEEMLGDYKDLVNTYVKNDRKAATINIYFGWELLSLIKRAAEITLLMFLGFSSLEVGGVILTVGLISAFSENLDKMINPINAIFQNLNELEDSMVGATRAFLFIDEENDTRTLDGDDAPDVIKGEVEFKNIRFAYVDNKYVLDDVSLHVEAGKTIGIVGHTGSGKSSMMNLLLAYNDYQEGSLLVDGVDIKRYNKASYRRNLGIVLQTPALFAGTLRTNLTMERDIYTDEEIINVLNAVGAGYMLNKTEYGLDMPITFKGDNLSLGEKQLIAFARILLRNPKILVLDEATANIDSDTEAKIKNAMDIVAKDRTSFIIAHRLSTIKNADEIIVLDSGRIVGKGTHESLYRDCLQYRDMYDSQYNNKE
ncbi:MAG: ABC transporter ATP-binding protein [Erysipelotrichaceae bacterium]|nr:ABC transporter ATP-binding protein [Erysipelotrichaceae bacterium]